MKTEKVNVCTMSDLEAWCDWKIPELCGLVEESMGPKRKVIKVLTKVLPRLDHHFGIVNGVSKEKYGGNNDLWGVTG